MTDPRQTTLRVPTDAVAIRLYRIRGGDLVPCAAVRFHGGAPALDTTLRRAAISGRVEVDGEIQDHFADLLDATGDMVGTVALDAASYRAIKDRWARTTLERRAYD